jgi:hypothetical protein
MVSGTQTRSQPPGNPELSKDQSLQIKIRESNNSNVNVGTLGTAKLPHNQSTEESRKKKCECIDDHL